MNIICYEIRQNVYEIEFNYHQKMSVHPISLIMSFESKNKSIEPVFLVYF